MKIFLFVEYLLILTITSVLNTYIFTKFQRRKIGHRQNTYCKFPHSGESCCFFIGKRPSGRKNNFFRKKIKFHPGEIENGLGWGETGKGR